MDAAAEIDPALAAEDLRADEFDGDEGGDRDDVGGDGDVEQAVVVDQ